MQIFLAFAKIEVRFVLDTYISGGANKPVEIRQHLGKLSDEGKV